MTTMTPKKIPESEVTTAGLSEAHVGRLQIIWKESFPGKRTWWSPGATREQVFRRKAREAGYDEREIALFLTTRR